MSRLKIRARLVDYGWRLRALWRKLLLSLGLDLTIQSDDRRILHDMIFPFVLEHQDLRRVLFVGVEWYTRGYEKRLKGKDFVTLEIDPGLANYGARRHIVDNVEHVREHFAPDSLDVVFMNGVFGWGLNARDAVDRAFGGCFEALRPGGLFIIGWNDNDEHRPFPLAESAALGRFEPFEFPPLGTAMHRTTNPNGHVYSFYRKP